MSKIWQLKKAEKITQNETKRVRRQNSERLNKKNYENENNFFKNVKNHIKLDKESMCARETGNRRERIGDYVWEQQRKCVYRE